MEQHPVKESQFERIPAATAYLTFRSTAYSSDKALAELVDNSIQAGASQIRVILNVQQIELNSRRTMRVSEIYVCDNGVGMDQNLLTRCLGISESIEDLIIGFSKRFSGSRIDSHKRAISLVFKDAEAASNPKDCNAVFTVLSSRTSGQLATQDQKLMLNPSSRQHHYKPSSKSHQLSCL